VSEDRFREAFRRITAQTPDEPSFTDLDTQRLTPPPERSVKPWMVAIGTAVLVMVVVGAFGLLGGGGPDLAVPDDDGMIDYIKLEYKAGVEPVCEGGEIVDNGGFDEATIEIWGPNEDEITLMVSTFPDGSTERTVMEGDPLNPERSWVNDPDSYPNNTRYRVVRCDGTDLDETPLLSGLAEPTFGAPIPVFFVTPLVGTWAEMFPQAGARPEVWDGINVILYPIRYESEAGTESVDFYVADDDQTLLRQHARMTYEGIGTAEVDSALVENKKVDAGSVSFDVGGLTAVVYDVPDMGREQCPVTIPASDFTPPDSHPENPSGWPDSVWYGSNDLWTVLPLDGSYQPRKSVWWSAKFPGGGIESDPEITLRYELLESRRKMSFAHDDGTNANTAQDGWFMIAGIDPPITGCWLVTAIYKGASLSYVYYNDSYGADPESIVVPDVVGLTVDRARNVLHDTLYEASFFDSADPAFEVCAQEPGAGIELNPWETVGMRTAPAGGCGELMGGYVEPAPNVVGLTVGEAKVVLGEAGYSVSTSSSIRDEFEVCAQGSPGGSPPPIVKLDGAEPGQCPP
jgi:hypothetical protein